MTSSVREKIEYAAVRVLVGFLGALPRPLARAAAIMLAKLVQVVHRKLWRVGMRNLEIAFPESKPAERRRILRQVFAGLGRQLAEFSHFPRYTIQNAKQIAIYEGFENFDAALK